MMNTMTTIIGGILLPESFLQSEFFAVLAAFVAVNTLMYVSLSIGKILPKIYFSDMLKPFRKNRRRAYRGINENPVPVNETPAEHA